MITKPIAAIESASTSQRLVAVAVVLAFCYLAAGLVVTLLLSVLLAYMLDPAVVWLERLRMPRALASLLVVFLAMAIVVGISYLVFNRLEQFAADWPKYSATLKRGASVVERRLEKLESRVSEITPGEQQRAAPAIRVEQYPLRGLLLRGLGSVYAVLLQITFVPFLVFFMLAGKRNVWHSTLELFATSERTRVKHILDQVTALLRTFVLGNALVAAILVAVTWIFFWFIGLEYPFLTGLVSGLLNMVPYLGAVLAWVPPFVIGLSEWKSIGPYLLVAGTLSLFHILVTNLLMPALVGRRVRLSALAVTVSLLFWGWLWGAAGFILAIPITATLKVICDNVESWQPVGQWLDNGS